MRNLTIKGETFNLVTLEEGANLVQAKVRKQCAKNLLINKIDR